MGNRVVLSGSSFLPSLPAAYAALQDALQNIYGFRPIWPGNRPLQDMQRICWTLQDRLAAYGENLPSES